MSLSYTGHTTLENLAEAKALNQWMYQAIRPYLRGTVLELGSGTGTFSELALTDFDCWLSDSEQAYCEHLQHRFKRYSHFRGAIQIDLERALPNSVPTDQYDSIFAVNVFEHIKDDSQAVKNAYQLLKPNGTLVLFVPAIPSLLNDLDKSFGHYRRYTRSSLHTIVHDNGFVIEHIRAFNPLGIPGWFTVGTVFHAKQLPQSTVALYDTLLPLARLVDRIAHGAVGLSLIAIARRI